MKDRQLVSRRRFLGGLGSTAVWGLTAPALAERILQDPYRPLAVQRPDFRPIRVRGWVRSADRGLEGVAVSDGLSVVSTDAEGSFRLVSHSGRRHLFVTVPSGYQIPVKHHGTARHFWSLGLTGEPEEIVLFELEPLPESDSTHAFLLLADPQTQDQTEVEFFQETTVPDVRRSVANLGSVPSFGVGCGDLMWDNLELYPHYEEAVRRMGIPFFQVVGNHDLDLEAATNEDATRTFQKHFGPEYYSFNRGAVHYVVLNDVFWYGGSYIAYLTSEQLRWLEADLRLVEPGSPVVVFLHIPLSSTAWTRRGEVRERIFESVQNRELLYRLLEPFQAHVLAGHTHESEHRLVSGVREHIHGTVCGAWWSGPICWDGTPSGYAVYEVQGEEIRWRYKATGRLSSEQLTLYPRGADPGAPDEMVANVWNWDPDWKVFWYEDGVRKGAMARRRGQDPDSVRLHLGPDIPARRPWVEPVPSDHLFYAPVDPASRQIRVEAVDGFGRTYTADMENTR